MALLKRRRPYVWEGENRVDLISAYAPWAAEQCATACAVDGVCCAIVLSDSGTMNLRAISDEFPLHTCRHYVAAVAALPAEAIPVDADTASAQTFYASRGVVIIGSVVDGDCGIDVMNMMLDQQQTRSARNKLRDELSDYLMDRAGQSWMQDVLVVCEEISSELVKRSRSDLSAAADLSLDGVVDLTVDLETVADPVQLELTALMDEVSDAPPVHGRIPTDEEMAAMRWASNIQDDNLVRNLVRDLPLHVVEEQIAKHKQSLTTVAKAATSKRVIHVQRTATLQQKYQVAKALHEFCASHGHLDPLKLSRRQLHAWAVDRVHWGGKKQSVKNVVQNIRRWYQQWKSNASSVAEFSMATAGVVQQTRKLKEVHNGVADWKRKRAVGAGKKRRAECIGRALYEWFVGLRYAIDWKNLAAQNRSRGKRCLARFPRSVIRQKLLGLLEDHAYAVLLNGKRVLNFQPSNRWLRQWEHEYGLSMRKANRKFEVPRDVLQERLHIGWANIYRIRKFMKSVLGYEPVVLNWDQSPTTHSDRQWIMGLAPACDLYHSILQICGWSLDHCKANVLLNTMCASLN